ncbi:hypothetical protein [Mesorhizobium sp. M4B.F.Ca.ET.143.01.1.1]|uniref:hypothetical protein n=1 Tax=Mesorhizobium sp. M4B.F.Ca.ET.143.01.1.1 TaxID=2563947 RepID=UPI001093FC53|nr:hypothetical protein [Mesorhizobium sp. M4B.F.Ca.ET.143.01.1.1]TGV26321.1 hypothetical protein EN786_12410 [Mesorhizobium sp. M4B.F.Ca.ET.143.01.1.1]
MGEHPRFWVAFSILLASLALAMFMSVVLTIRAHAAPMPSPPIVHITNDGGGSVTEYYQRYKALSNAGTEIHFHGWCMSACTMFLFTEFTGIKACADPGAMFGFHKPFQMKSDRKTALRTKAAVRSARQIWSLYLESLPPLLRQYLKRVRVPSPTAGDETNTMLIIPAEMLLPRCSNTVAAQ